MNPHIHLITLQVGGKFNRLDQPDEVLELKERNGTGYSGFKLVVWNHIEQKEEEIQFKRGDRVVWHRPPKGARE